VLALRASALRHNVVEMQRYCDERDLLLAPHAKTTMAPQLIAEQIRAGCWAVTCATPAHLRVYRRFGIGRVFYANQVVEPAVIRWLADELRRDATFELYCLVDSPEGVASLDRVLAERPTPRPLPVLIELGHAGGRAGCRDHADVVRVARALEEATNLRLVGVEAFEGLIRPAPGEGLGAVDAFLAEVVQEVGTLLADGTLPSDAIVSAGGSAYFDRVVEAFEPLRSAGEVHFVLRSGCYITQDDGYYEQISPAARGADAPRLRNAIEVWAAVVSRPEPGLVIAGLGKRDVPADLGLPRPVVLHRPGRVRVDIAARSSIVALSDQHAHVRVDADVEAAPGDVLGCTISHPCTALDKWRFIPVVDDADVVVDGVLTFF
jgi:D-serine deaminase-like pyridoxal phosphate-dependent protein